MSLSRTMKGLRLFTCQEVTMQSLWDAGRRHEIPEQKPKTILCGSAETSVSAYCACMCIDKHVYILYIRSKFWQFWSYLYFEQQVKKANFHQSCVKVSHYVCRYSFSLSVFQLCFINIEAVRYIYIWNCGFSWWVELVTRCPSCSPGSLPALQSRASKAPSVCSA